MTCGDLAPQNPVQIYSRRTANNGWVITSRGEMYYCYSSNLASWAKRKNRDNMMKALLFVFAALFVVTPAYAFENLIIDSAFQYPVEFKDNATSWSDVRPTDGPFGSVDYGHIHGTGFPAQNQSLFAVPNLVSVANLFVSPNLFASPNLLASPNPFVSASPSSLVAQTKPPGNFS
jgi:hypothetical protein